MKNTVPIGLIVESSRAGPSWTITRRFSFKAIMSHFQKSSRSVALEFGRFFDERWVCRDEPHTSSQAPVSKLMIDKDDNWIYVRVTNISPGKCKNCRPNPLGDFGPIKTRSLSSRFGQILMIISFLVNRIVRIWTM
jgi:hypothetical protein